jgi:hypothetical protein
MLDRLVSSHPTLGRAGKGMLRQYKYYNYYLGSFFHLIVLVLSNKSGGTFSLTIYFFIFSAKVSESRNQCYKTFMGCNFWCGISIITSFTFDLIVTLNRT